MRIIGLIPCLIFLACHCHCLLRNCVSEEDWENDTSGSPRCEVVTPQKVEVECYGTKTETEISVNRISSYQQTENNTPVIICNASYPIDVDEDGFKVRQCILSSMQINIVNKGDAVGTLEWDFLISIHHCITFIFS